VGVVARLRQAIPPSRHRFSVIAFVLGVGLALAFWTLMAATGSGL